ncbi:hypothetical protein Tsubulata_014757 [Turnera subulata]|uniref:DUF4283 domain-containing protein n=1 Tax=Turnera subulata TaxID=218843 RepID=A0A9Q0F0U1_9ROSI|nr:hypothetical protein Tsubulata_014757 [Turnera subulata]
MQLWKLGAVVELLDMDHGSYLAKFTSLADLEKVVTRGPWMVQDHYLTVRQWSPNFRPDSDHIHSTMAWVRLPGFPLMYYDDDLLTTFATGIGNHHCLRGLPWSSSSADTSKPGCQFQGVDGGYADLELSQTKGGSKRFSFVEPNNGTSNHFASLPVEDVEDWAPS